MAVFSDWAVPVVERFNAACHDTQASAGIDFHYPGESDSVGGNHAAEWETSYLWCLRRDCVELNESIFVALWPRRSL